MTPTSTWYYIDKRMVINPKSLEVACSHCQNRHGRKAREIAGVVTSPCRDTSTEYRELILLPLVRSIESGIRGSVVLVCRYFLGTHPDSWSSEFPAASEKTVGLVARLLYRVDSRWVGRPKALR